MELICPSCEARYQLAEGAIGEKGRQVSCMNCGHGWHAYPPLVLETPTGPVSPIARWHQGTEGGSDAGHASDSAQRPVLDRGRPAAPAQMATSRSEQMAEIRDILAEVQSEEHANAALSPDPVDDGRTRIDPRPEPSEEPKPATDPGPAAAARGGAAAVTSAGVTELDDAAAARARQIERDFSDPLREQIGQVEKKREKPLKRPDDRRLRRAHDRKERKRKRREAAGSGAFLTGFLLVVMIVSLMAAIYLLHPQIIERVPSLAPALTDYVATIDGLRVNIAEGFEKARDWVVNSANKGG